MKNTLPGLTESQIQTQIMNYLQVKGFYVMRLNSGMVENKYGGRIRLAPIGTPDIMAFKKHINAVLGKQEFGVLELLFIEVKRPKGKVTFYQEQKMKELEEYGAICFVAHSLDEIMERIK